MLVASLYNIVDQIYIGYISEVDSLTGEAISILCNGATNVVYPFILIALAICLLLGDGAASLFSLYSELYKLLNFSTKSLLQHLPNRSL